MVEFRGASHPTVSAFRTRRHHRSINCIVWDRDTGFEYIGDDMAI